MNVFGLIWIVLPVIPSLALTWLLWPRENSFQPPFPFKLILATGLALGFSSMVLLLVMETAGQLKPSYLFVELVLVVVATVFILWRILARTPATDSPFRYPVQPRLFLSFLLWGFFCFLLSLAVVNFALWTINHPNGGWEALQNWNLRAAFLNRGGDQWRNVFSPELWSASSPMLISSSIARAWHYLESESGWVRMLLAMFFTFGTVGLLVTALLHIRGEIRSLVAGLFLLGTTMVIRHGAFQQADIPIGFFLLATFILLHFSSQCGAEGRNGLHLLAGLTAGCALWTKDDAVWLLLGLAVTRAFAVRSARGWKGVTKDAFLVGSGMLPFLLILIWLKATTSGLHSWFSFPDPATLFPPVSEPRRLFAVVQALVRSVFSFSGGAMVLLVIFLLVCGRRVDAADRADVNGFCLFLLLAWGGFVAYFLVVGSSSTAGIAGWVTHSANRLLLQLWPSILFFVFLVCNLPRRPHESHLGEPEPA